MRAVLLLQTPSNDWRSGCTLAASLNAELIQHFRERVLAEAREEADKLSDPIARQLARLRAQQLEERLAVVLNAEGNGSLDG